MIIKCNQCSKNLSPKDPSDIFDGDAAKKRPKLDYIFIYYYLLFDCVDMCCKQTLIPYISNEFFGIFRKSNKYISNLDDTSGYIKNIKRLLKKRNKL